MRYRRILGLLAGVIAGFMISDAQVMTAAAEEVPQAVLYSASDFQNEEGHAQGAKALIELTEQIYNSGNTTIAEAMICGDYYYAEEISKEESEQGIKSVYEVLQAQWGLGYDEIYFVQGNHDPAETSGLDATGGTEREFYSVYQMNHDDYLWNHQAGIDHETIIRESAEELREWLGEKVKKGDHRPIFVISHLPLHHTYRYDNPYAEYIFDVINQAGEQGLNIVYLFGHNHSREYDKYLGGGAIYLTKGDEMIIPDIQGDSAADYKSEILNFTYMNAGYIGEATDGILSSCIFEIYEDRMEIKRYTQEGVYDLKQVGISSAKDLGWKANSISKKSPQMMEFNDLTIWWSEEAETEKIQISPGTSQNLSVNINSTETVSIRWECSDSDVLQVQADEKDSSKACIIGKNYGTAIITVIVEELSEGQKLAKLTKKVLVVPENAVSLSYGEHVRFYEQIPDLSTALQDDPGTEREYIIANSGKTGAAKALAAQSDEYLGTEEAKILFVPGVGNVIAENSEKNILWQFQEIEGIEENVSEYQLRLTKKSLYRYGYYIAVTYGVDSSLGHPDVTNMRTCSQETSSGAAAFRLDNENPNSIETEHHFKDIWKKNDQGIFSLVYDRELGKFLLSNQEGKEPVSFFGRTGEIISDILMWTDSTSGKATIGIAEDEPTGGVVCVMHGEHLEEIPITLEMLDGYDEAVEGTYHCTVSFNGEIVSENYELTLENEGFDFIKLLKRIVDLILN